MIIFMLLPILGIIYVSWHLWVLMPLSVAFRTTFIGMLIISFLLIFLNLSHTIDKLPIWLAQFIYDVGNSTIFILLYLVIIFIAVDLGLLLRLIPKALVYQSVYGTLALTIGLFFLFLYGNIHYHNKVREEIHLTTSKPITKPIRLVLLSDLHLGYHNPKKELARWVDMINLEKPDYVLIAGDVIDISTRPLFEERMAEELQRIKVPVYACIGNHEFYSGKDGAKKFFKESGIYLLQDSCITIGDLCIIGRDDRTNMRRMPLDSLIQHADMSKYTILLDHQPYHLEKTEDVGIDFQFSGHTHQGQVWPISWITNTLYECSYGFYQRGKTQYYISSGIGIWGGKFRIGTQSEYIVAELTQENY